jgi:hypothetical protein
MRGGFIEVPSTFATELGYAASRPGKFARNLFAFVTNRPRAGLEPEDRGSQRITATAMYVLGDFIRRNYPPGITVVYDQAGQAPWYAGLDKTFIDPFGLTERDTGFAAFNHALAARPNPYFELYRDISSKLLGAKAESSRTWDFKEAADHIFRIRPHLIVLGVFSWPLLQPDGSKVTNDADLSGVIGGDSRLAENYVKHVFEFNRIYERRDLSDLARWTHSGLEPR